MDKENISITLHVTEVEDIIDDLHFSAKKLNLRYEHGAGQHQEDLANKIDLQLQKHFEEVAE